MFNPIISVLCTSYKENIEFLRQNIKSVQEQSFEDFEYIIVLEPDDVNAINFIRSISDHRIKCHVNSEKRGFVCSLNVGLNLSKGKYIARIDSDDYIYNNRLKNQYEFLEKHSEIDVLGGAINQVDLRSGIESVVRYPLHHEEIAQAMQYTCAMAHPAIMAKKDILSEVGGYNEEYPMCEDLELWLRLIKAGYKFHNLPEVVTHHRVTTDHALKYHSKKLWFWKLKIRLSLLSLTPLSIYSLRGALITAIFFGIHMIIFPTLATKIGKYKTKLLNRIKKNNKLTNEENKLKDLDSCYSYIPSDSNVLDVGCLGFKQALRTKELGYNFNHYGIDVTNPEEKLPNGFIFRKADLSSQSIPYDDDKFDLVVASHVIEHVSKPIDFFGECVRVCKPGGLMYFAAPSERSLLLPGMPFDHEKMCVLSFFDDPTHIFRPWTPQAFYNLTKFFSCEPILVKHLSSWKHRLIFPFTIIYALVTRNALRLEIFSWATTGWACCLIAKKPKDIQGKPDFRYYIPKR